MKKVKAALLSIFVFSNLGYPVKAQSSGSYIEQRSVRVKEKSVDANTPGTTCLRLSDWVGRKFVLMPFRKSLQHFGYQFSEGHNTVPYEKAVGRIGKVESIEGGDGIRGGDFSKLVRIKMEDTGEIYTSSYSLTSAQFLALIDDIEDARKKWLGKTLWLTNSPGIFDTYDESADMLEFTNKFSGNYTAVKVENIVLSTDEATPIRFIFTNALGRQAFKDYVWSGTNSSLSNNCTTPVKNRLLSEFMVDDPKLLYKFSEKTWQAIYKRQVFLGMNKEEASMSWGLPESINETITPAGKIEQWVYHFYSTTKGEYLYFENGILTSLQQ
jgi:hypothetical protein